MSSRKIELSPKRLKFSRIAESASDVLAGYLTIEVENETFPSGAPLRYVVTATEEAALREVLDRKETAGSEGSW